MKFPTLTQYDQYLNAADAESDKDRNVVQLMQALELFVTTNPRIKGHLNTRKAAAASWDWTIQPYDMRDVERSEQAKMRLKKLINSIARNISYVSVYGCMMIQIRWELIDQKQVPIFVKSYLPYEIQAGLDGAIYELVNNQKIRREENDPNYILKTDGERKPGGLMRSIGAYEILRRDMTYEWANFNKKQKGIIQGVERGASDDERSVAENALKTAIQNNYLLTSDLIDFKFHQLTNATGGMSFKEMIEHLNNSIAIALLGQANTPELPKGGGSRAASQVQAMITADITYLDMLTFEDVINEQLIRTDWKLNYGEDSEPVYEFKLLDGETEDYVSNASVVNEVLSNGQIPLLRSEVYDKIGFTMPNESDDVIAGAGV